MTDSQQVQLVRANVESINDAVISNPDPKPRAAHQSVVMKSVKLQAEFVQLRVNAGLNGHWKLQESCVKSRIKNLRCRAHSTLLYSRTNIPFHLILGLADLRFKGGCELKFVLDQIVEKIAHLANILTRKFAYVRLDLLNRSHPQTMACRLASRKLICIERISI